MPKKVQINFDLKTPAELASRLGVSKARAERILTIMGDGSSQKKRGNLAPIASSNKSKYHRLVGSRSARRNNAKAAR